MKYQTLPQDIEVKFERIRYCRALQIAKDGHIIQKVIVQCSFRLK